MTSHWSVTLCLALLSLVSLPTACDVGDETDEPAVGTGDTGASTSGSEEGAACKPTSPPPGAALLDHANCIHQDTGIPLASCSSAIPMLRPCDEAFLGWCNAYGGDAIACEQDEIAIEEHRCGGGPAFVPCDLTFTASCDSADGVFTCDDPEGGICLSGSCTEPPVKAVVLCCGNVDGGSGAGDNCHLSDNQKSLFCATDEITLACSNGVSCIGCDENGEGCLCQCTG